MEIGQSIIVPTKLAMAGIIIGVFSGFIVAQLNPGPSMAAVAKQPPFNYGKALDVNLARFNGDYFAVGTEPGVSLTPQSEVQIRKIGYGQTSFVSVITTASGTYSSDAMFSPHIRYPGIHVEPLQQTMTPFGAVLGWSKLTGWTKIPLLSANSIGFLDDYTVPASQNGVCLMDNELGGCR